MPLHDATGVDLSSIYTTARDLARLPPSPTVLLVACLPHQELNSMRPTTIPDEIPPVAYSQLPTVLIQTKKKISEAR